MVRERIEALLAALRPHAHKLKWLHSFWALALGAVVMFFSRQDFRYVRLIVGYLVFIWAASLLLHWEAGRFGLTEERRPKLRRLVLYIIQNFYYEMLFFLLPLYYLSTTLTSGNVLFLLLVAGCAVVASFDVIYWRWLTQRTWISEGFYAVILFACFNIFLPVLFGMRNTYSLYLAGVMSCIAFATLNRSPREWFTGASARRLGAGAVASVLVLFFLRGFIPPSPLHLSSVIFARSFDPATLSVRQPVTRASELGNAPRVYALALVKAPMGIHERVYVAWYRDGEKVSEGHVVNLQGGRKSGFRLWAGLPTGNTAGAAYRIDVLTEGGQLIGRATLPAR